MGCGASIQAPSSNAPAPTKRPHPADEASLQAAAAKVLRAHLLVEQGDYAGALQLLEPVVQTFPWVARAHLEKGNACYGLNQYEQALECFNTALECQDSYIHAHIRRAHVLLKLKRSQEAMQDVAAALAIDPDNAELKTLKQRIIRRATSIRRPAPQPAAGATYTSVDVINTGQDSPVAKLCMVCMEEERGCRLQPCMHACLCKRCASSMQAKHMGCPLCSQTIVALEHGVFASTFAAGELGRVLSPHTDSSTPDAAERGQSPGLQDPFIRQPTSQAWA